MGNASRYASMKYNRCGRSGLLLPAVSLGLWQNFGADSDFENIRAMILTAFDIGITHFDLANNYGPPPGSAESNFGRVLHKDLSKHRDELIISTKAGYYMWPGPYGDWGSRKYLLASLDQSLKRMGLDYVDIFYHHRPDPDTPLEETMGALDTAVRSGRALYVGISNYKPPETERAIKILRELGTPCLIHQPLYNMLNRWIEDGLLDTLSSNGVGCVAFSPLAQGLLAGRYLEGIPAGSRAERNKELFRRCQITEESLQQLRELDSIARQRGQTSAQLALSWVLRRPEITSVLVGASNPEQLRENVAVLEKPNLTPGEIDKIESILSILKRP